MQLEHLRTLVDDACRSVDDLLRFTPLAVNFHQAVAEASNNRALQASLAAVRATQLEHLGPETTRTVAERVSRVHASILEAIGAHDDAGRAMQLFRMDQVRKFVLIVVNASVPPDDRADRRENSPGVMEVARAAGRVPISRYSFETFELFKESLEKWQRDTNARLKPAAPTPVSPAGTASDARPEELQFYPIEVTFDALADEAERRFFKTLPTTLGLPADTVDRLRAVAARLLRQSQDYRKLLRDLNGPVTR